jgi:hypothetical protein
MTWFGVSLLFECTVAGQARSPRLFEERVFLISADDLDDAQLQANVLGRDEELAYENEDGESVSWMFVRVLDVKELFDPVPRSNSEVFYRYLTLEEANALERAADPSFPDPQPRHPRA